MATTINIRIRKIIDEKFNGNADKFAAAIDIPKTTLSSIIGKKQAKPSSIILEAIIKTVKDINANWLLTGDGEMENNSNASIVQEPPANYGKTIIDMFKAGEIYPSFVVEKKEKEIALLNQEIGRLKAELDQKKKISALLVDNAGVADAG